VGVMNLAVGLITASSEIYTDLYRDLPDFTIRHAGLCMVHASISNKKCKKLFNLTFCLNSSYDLNVEYLISLQFIGVLMFMIQISLTNFIVWSPLGAHKQYLPFQ
jgi:hypothetical protein